MKKFFNERNIIIIFILVFIAFLLSYLLNLNATGTRTTVGYVEQNKLK